MEVLSVQKDLFVGQVLVLQLIQLILQQQRPHTGCSDLPVQLFVLQDFAAQNKPAPTS